jgi:hypothetical protein
LADLCRCRGAGLGVEGDPSSLALYGLKGVEG